MSTQNGFFKIFELIRFLIHTFQLEIWSSKAFPYVCIGKPFNGNVCHPRATYMGATSGDDLYRLLQNLMQGFLMVKKLSDGTVCFFLLSWCSLLKKKISMVLPVPVPRAITVSFLSSLLAASFSFAGDLSTHVVRNLSCRPGPGLSI